MIVAPIFNNPTIAPEWIDKLIHYRDAYAFSHLFALCERLRIEPLLIPHNRLAEYQEMPDMICIGGPLSNNATRLYLNRYVKGLKMVGSSGDPITEWQEGGGFMIGDQAYFETETEQFGVLVRITEKELGQRRTIHLVFGYGAMATAAAGYYLWKHVAEIAAGGFAGKYCIIVTLRRGEGYKSVQQRYLDRTEAAFGK